MESNDSGGFFAVVADTCFYSGGHPAMLSLNSKRLRQIFAGMFWVAICCFQPLNAYAHGTQMTYQLTTGIVVQALYKSGQPMSSAQITVFAPDDPARPWLVGSSDDQGRFSFVPDSGVPGIWSVQARQSGHGAMIHIDVGHNDAATAISPATQVVPTTSLLQRLLMAAAVIWGCVGTALYFTRKRSV
jgi:nickel transport protein